MQVALHGHDQPAPRAGVDGGQIADLDHVDARDRMTDMPGDGGLDRQIEVLLEEQAVVRGRRVAQRRDPPSVSVAVSGQRVAEMREPRPIRAGKLRADEGFQRRPRGMSRRNQFEAILVVGPIVARGGHVAWLAGRGWQGKRNGVLLMLFQAATYAPNIKVRLIAHPRAGAGPARPDIRGAGTAGPGGAPPSADRRQRKRSRSCAAHAGKAAPFPGPAQECKVYKTILVRVDGSPARESRVRAAAIVAENQGSHLIDCPRRALHGSTCTCQQGR